MARLRRAQGLSFNISLLAFSALPAFAAAESLPASVRACASETDSLRRLVCYDREVARSTESKPGAQPGPSRQSDPSTAATPSTQGAPAVRTPPAPPSPPTQAAGSAPTAPSTVPAPATPAAAKSAATAPNSGRISAHVVGIDPSPSEMVLHLDNGQVWQQLQAASGDLSLQVGDTVTIDKHFGSFWLSGPHVSGMKVRQKT